MDAKITLSTQQSGSGFYVAQFKTAELAVFTYYVESRGEAILIDPTLDTLVYRQLLETRKATLKYVFLTHYHADFLSGHLEFKVPIVMGHGSKREISKFEVLESGDGTIIQVGEIKLKVIHTPGHTLESSTFLLFDNNSVPICIFTGDTLFLGDVGRPDLAANSSLTPSDLAGLLFDSVQKLKALEGDIRVYPAHGAGSSCGKGISTGNFCTLDNQKANNYALKITQKQQFIQSLLEGMPKPPKYFFYDAKLNQTGVSHFDEALKQANNPLSLEQFTNHSQKSVIVDTRNEVQLLIKGAFWLPAKGAIASWLSNYFGPQTEFLLFTETGKWQDTAERFFRIGYFNIKGYNNFTVNEWKGELLKPKIIKLQQFLALKDFQHLDVRNIPEFKTGGVVQKSILIPLPELRTRAEQLNGHKNLVVSCRTGLRARVAFSVLAQSGIEPLILAQNFDQFSKQEGIRVVPFTA